MKCIRTSIIIGLAVLGLGSANLALAQAAPGHSEHTQLTLEQRAAKVAERRARRAERVAQRQARLHEALKLTSAQEGAWRDYVAALQPAHDADAHARMDRAALRSMPAPQRMEARLALAKKRIAHMQARLAATKTFYAQLSADQQKAFDAAMKMRPHGKRHGMQHGAGHDH